MLFIAFGKAMPNKWYGRCRLTRKTLLMIKCTAFLILAACLHLSAATNAQGISVSFHQEKLQTVIAEIKKQSGLQFFYNDAMMHNINPVTLDVKNASLADVLDICFRNQPLTYSIIANTVVIKDKTQEQADAKAFPPGEIRGRVTNVNGQSISNANVTIKRTGRGTITNAKGEFVLKDVKPNDVIVISFIGLKTIRITPGSQTNLTLVMEQATDELDKVVVQAYGTTSQRLSTGNIATVTAAEIEKHPVMNPLAALQGQVAGLVITQNNGYASAPFKVEIRGRSVINPDLPSEPLYIIDGVPLTTINLGQGGNYATGSMGVIQNGFTGPAGGQSPLFSLNPLDIETITVLKDADATAIYGSRGANGVIIINTKKGKAGKTKFEVDAYYGVNKATSHYSLLNTQQYVRMRKEAFKNDNMTMDDGNAYDLMHWDTTSYTDWQKVLWGGMGKTADVELILSGGDKQTTFRIAGDYHRQTDMMTVSGADQKASVQLNISHRSINQRLNTSFTSTYSYTQSNLISLAAAATLPPNAPAVFDNLGKLNYAGWGLANTTQRSAFPFANLLQPYTANTGFLNSQLTFQYELFQGLNFSTNLGYSTTHNSQKQIIPIASQDPALNPYGSSQFGNNNSVNYIVEPQLEYKTVIGKGKLLVLSGVSAQSVNSDGNTITGSGYTNDNLLQSVGNAPRRSAGNGSGQYKYSAVFARINYNWEDKYLINLSARRDGSSLFGPGRQFGNFGSIGAAWIFTEEPLIKQHLSFLSFGKLRGSYGTTGSDLIPSYQYLSQWSASGVIPYQFNGPAGYVPVSLYNENLEWQVNKKLEIALSLGFFHDRLILEIARYQNRCGNQLTAFPLPGITGFTSVSANSPALAQNLGWEYNLKYKIVDRKNWMWNISLDLGMNKNKLIAYPNLDKSPYASRYTIGQPLNITKVLHYLGVDPLTGQYSLQDRNHNGVIDYNYNKGYNDLYDKDMNIKLDGGFNSSVKYKNLEIGMLFTFRKQQLPSAIYNGLPGFIGNQSTQVLDRWQKPGDITKFARFTNYGTTSDNLFNGYSDGVYCDGSYIRLRNVSVTFDLPDRVVKKFGMQNCRIYARGENLLLISGYNGVDPDSPGLGNLPPLKAFTGGIQFNF